MTATNDLSFLMVGNSFTNENHLQEMIRDMLEQDLAVNRHRQPVYAMRFRKPSSRLAEDVNDPALQSTIAERAWTWVVLQEQSQIPAFFDTRFQPTFDLSVSAAQQINQWIASNNSSETVLMMTWGRRTVSTSTNDPGDKISLPCQVTGVLSSINIDRRIGRGIPTCRYSPLALTEISKISEIIADTFAFDVQVPRLHDNANQTNGWIRKVAKCHVYPRTSRPDCTRWFGL